MPARVEVITGPMFCGKSWALAHRILEEQYAHRRTLIVKPIADTRNKGFVVARGIGTDGKDFAVYSFSAMTIDNPAEIIDHLDRVKPHLLAIDEAHLFKPTLIDIIDELRNRDNAPELDIIVAGLDMDHLRRPFPIVAHCMAIADGGITKLHGVCMKCGAKSAAFTQAIRPLLSAQEVGSRETYEIRCRACHRLPAH